MATRGKSLSERRKGIVLNGSSQRNEALLNKAKSNAIKKSLEKHGLEIYDEKVLSMSEVRENLINVLPKEKFSAEFDSAKTNPDGGILYIKNKSGEKFPILVSETKNQESEGNAIERVGKDIRVLESRMLGESIFPYLVFCQGEGFKEGKSHLASKLFGMSLCRGANKLNVRDVGDNLKAPSFFYQGDTWSVSKMSELMERCIDISIKYYLKKYGGKKNFIRKAG